MGILDTLWSQVKASIRSIVRRFRKQKKSRTISQIANLPPILDIWAQKGGSGKTAVCAALAILLARFFRVAVVDCDVDSPYLPVFFHLTEKMKFDKENKFIPVQYQHMKDGVPDGNPIKVVSVGLFPTDDPRRIRAISKQGPEYHRIIQDMFARTAWGDIDLIIAVSPAGSSDPLRAILRCSHNNLVGSFVVMLPYITAGLKRVAKLAITMGNPILGVIENQKYLVCDCNRRIELFPLGQDEESITDVCVAAHIPYLGDLPHIPGYRGPEMPQQYSGPLEAACRIVREKMRGHC